MAKATKEKLKILYHGNFDRLSVGEPEIASCLEELGHEVTRLPERSTPPFKILEALGKDDYDFFFFAKGRFAPYEEREELLKNLKIPSVCWVFDLFFGL